MDSPVVVRIGHQVFFSAIVSSESSACATPTRHLPNCFDSTKRRTNCTQVFYSCCASLRCHIGSPQATNVTSSSVHHSFTEACRPLIPCSRPSEVHPCMQACPSFLTLKPVNIRLQHYAVVNTIVKSERLRRAVAKRVLRSVKLYVV
jgi:hypothetical protein